MNIGNVFFQISVFIFFRDIPGSGTVGSYGSYIHNLLRNLHIVFHSSYTNLQSHQQCMRIPFSVHPHQQLLFLVFFNNSYSTCMGWYFIIVLICISLIISNAEHFSMYPLVICMSSLEKCLFRSAAYF